MHPLAEALLAWYERNGRDLPWRRTQDPYAIWISEVMLQQTRVEAVLPFYERWMRRFPTVQVLAAAPRQEVFALWEGLGYYNRARNLHRAAQVIVAEHAGALPATVGQLTLLPGIGRYTAAAIAAIAFGADTLALDGNLRRVLSRLFDLEMDPRSPDGERQLQTRAAALLPPGRASAFNQALMDLGSTLCAPRAPSCGACPLATGCLAQAQGLQEARPVRKPSQPVPRRAVSAAVLRRAGKTLIARRPEGRLLGGLWEFPGGKQESGETLQACLRRELREELGIGVRVGRQLGVFQHAYTHFQITVHVFECRVRSGEPSALEHTAIRWADPRRLARYPMGKVDREIARMLVADGKRSAESYKPQGSG